MKYEVDEDARVPSAAAAAAAAAVVWGVLIQPDGDIIEPPTSAESQSR